MTQQETLYAIALQQLQRIKIQDQNHLLETLGSAQAVYEHRSHLREVLPEATEAMERELQMMDLHLKRAEEELLFMQKGGVRALGRLDAEYPSRLRECSDAPLILYYCGRGELNVQHVVSIVGTRKITPYGKDLCATFAKDLTRLCPGTLVVSGLAYGVDIHSHRAALENGLPTVGVLAHGLEQIYPTMHRDTARQMVATGGLLTEYISRTPIDKRNFVQRNRIVAGMADATIVVESAAKGGSLITAEMASDYGREVMAFPGRTTDPYSAGCNMLIRTQRAALIEDAEQFVTLMGWEHEGQRQQMLTEGVQQELFPSLSPEETTVLNALRPTDGTPVNALAIQTGLAISTLSSLLFSLEMKGLVKRAGGNNYRRA